MPLKRRHTRHVTNIHVVQKEYTKNSWKKLWILVENLNEHYSTHIFCVTLYTCITIGVFLQAHNAVASNQPSGLARIGGGWMAVARASAAALMFNFSTLLLTMSRNTITLLRETFLHRYIPFDAAISMHKIIAWMALFFTALHVVAHGINFYSISTQSPSDLLCLFRDIWYPSDYLPSFVFWCYQTITGITGVLLTLNVIVMYVFACNFSRRAIFNWFQGTHKFGYVFLYFFSVLHGSGTLISSPRFYLFFLGPAILYTLDQLYSLSRKKAEISVVNAELLPSDVTHLEFKRPANFDYKAGQWVRIACLAQSPSEYHPFTLSSAPHEKTLKLHIRAVGPWTQNLRSIYDPETLRDSPYPKLYLDGPFGEGHQDWYKYEVSVLVGGGIGVTPFASILKDLVNTTQNGTNMTCQTVYFIWVTRDQKQYEWLMDIIQEVENKDKKMVLNTHIFITQFPQKFDLRTTMLYICEQHFQKIAGRSLFTGLRAITHFGRPDFLRFFASLAQEHNQVKNFGVFSCGPPAMTGSVEKACSNLNKYEGPTYSHHFENF